MTLRTRVSDWWWAAKVERLDSLARLTGMGLGAWTVVSAFLWPDRFQFANTIITGAIIAVCALVAWVRVGWLRMVNSAAAVWLFFSPMLLHYEQRNLAVSQMLVGLVVLVSSFLPLYSVSADEGDLLPPLRRA
jgi:hypothetical protein